MPTLIDPTPDKNISKSESGSIFIDYYPIQIIINYWSK